MGKQNRARRAAKHRERRRAVGRHRPDYSRRSCPDDLAGVFWGLVTGLSAWSDAEVRSVVDAMSKSPIDELDRCVHDAFRSVLHSLWAGGWQPADVDRQILRQLSMPHAELAAAMIAIDSRSWPAGSTDPSWFAQIDERSRVSGDVGDSVELTRRAEVLAVMLEWPRLMPLTPPPGEWRKSVAASGGCDPKVLRRVRAMLAKAESTTFEAEAAAFTAKAQQLMARHAIDRALLDAGATHDRAAPHARRIGVDDPYPHEKSLLLSVVTDTNRCRSVWSKEMGFSTILGFRIDLDVVEVLFTSLLAQATHAIVLAGPQSDGRGRSRTRSWRRSFWHGFASRMGDRLAGAVAASRDEAVHDHGDALLPILADRSSEVDDAVADAFPDLNAVRSTVSNGAGWYAGQIFADQADIAPGEALAS